MGPSAFGVQGFPLRREWNDRNPPAAGVGPGRASLSGGPDVVAVATVPLLPAEPLFALLRGEAPLVAGKPLCGPPTWGALSSQSACDRQLCGHSNTAHLSQFETDAALVVPASYRYARPVTTPQASADRRTGARVNLTLPPEVDHVLARLAAAAGTGKASFVREWLVSMTPQLQGMAEALEAARAGQVDSFTLMAKTMRGAVHRGEQAELELKTMRAMARKSRK